MSLPHNKQELRHFASIHRHEIGLIEARLREIGPPGHGQIPRSATGLPEERELLQQRAKAHRDQERFCNDLAMKL